MSRFGVFSLLLVLCLDFACLTVESSITEELILNDEEKRFKNELDEQFQKYLEPFLNAAKSQAINIDFKSADEFVESNLNELKDFGFRTKKPFDIIQVLVSAPRTVFGWLFTAFRALAEDGRPQGSTSVKPKGRSTICIYIKNFLRRIIGIIRYFVK